MDRLTQKMTIAWKPRSILWGFLAAYGVLGAIGAVCQAGYINADFVGYVTIAHRILDSARWINGYWSPLYSWCMLPLIAGGVDDLIAGRIVVIASGVGYVLGIYGLATRFLDGTSRWDSAMLAGLMFCATLQAAVWSSSLLDPDLLADALLFGCFFALLNLRPSRIRAKTFAGGLLAGLAFLGKAYFLPYLLILGPATILLQAASGWRNESSSKGTAGLRACLAGCTFFVLGLGIVAGPWIAVLSMHYHRTTFSTAGSANHANVGPANFGHDPLWSPGLTADFISDPHLAGDWSAFQDVERFKHQAKVFLHNASNCAGHIAAWLALWAAALVGAVWIRSADRPNIWRTPGHLWCVLAVALYCGGYCFINLEARYIVPVVSPLLCLSAMLMIRPLPGALMSPRVSAWFRAERIWWTGLLVVLPFSVQDIYRYDRAAFHHAGCMELRPFARITSRMNDLPRGPIASSAFHRGLLQAYASQRLADYLGAPLETDSAQTMEQLQKAGARIFLRWIDPQAPSAMDGFVPTAPWTLQVRLDAGDVRLPSAGGRLLEIYTLPNPAASGGAR